MKLSIFACLLLIIPVQAHSRDILSQDILAIDGDSMVDSVGLSPKQTLPSDIKRLLGGKWTVTDQSVGGATITGSNSVTSRAGRVNAHFSSKNRRNELLIWIGTNDGCNEGDDAATAATEAQTYLTSMLAVGWKITWLAMLPRNEAFCSKNNPPWATFRTDYNFAMWTWTQAHGVRYLDPVQDDHALGDATDLTYYQADGIHPTALTESIIAQQVVNLIGNQQAANVAGN